MFRRKTVLAGVLAVCCLAATPAFGQRPPEPGTTAPSVAEFDRLFQELHVKNQPWATIPWKVSVTEARRLAAAERKPVFLVVNTGNCLGFT